MVITTELDNVKFEAIVSFKSKGLATDSNGWEMGKVSLKGVDHDIKRTPTYIFPTSYDCQGSRFRNLREVVNHLVTL